MCGCTCVQLGCVAVRVQLDVTWPTCLLPPPSFQAYLRNLKFLPSPPGPGVIDGTVAMLDQAGGFLFLYNPNAASQVSPAGLLGADWRLDLVCAPGDVFLLAQVGPRGDVG